MALITPEQYERSLKNRKPKIFMNGKKVEDYLNNPNIRTVIEAIKRVINGPSILNIRRS
jgi:aromatic ring hydroxylase